MNKLRELAIDDLLSRITLYTDFHQVCEAVSDAYQLGSIQSVAPLFVGHSELNCKITTTRNTFVIKFFNKQKTKTACQSTVEALLFFEKNNIPFPHIVKSTLGYLYELPQNLGVGYLIVMEYFDGETFNKSPPSLNDKLSITKYLAHINSLSMNESSSFDSWLSVYLAGEYDKNKKILSTEDNELVFPVVEAFKKIDLSKFSRGVVHYDLHRDNIQKASNGNFCLFDLETVGEGYPVLDLTTYIGLTCLELTASLEENRDICGQVLTEYQTIKPLTSEELSCFDVLIKAIFASNVIAANSLIKLEADDTQETYKWYELGKKGLEKFGALSLVSFNGPLSVR